LSECKCLHAPACFEDPALGRLKLIPPIAGPEAYLH
jgi:hypothetical protein